MSQRIIHYAAQDRVLASTPFEEVGRYARGIVAALGDDAALTLLGLSSASLLFFSRQSFEYALRGLSDEARNEAVVKRLEQWSGNAANEGIDWLYRCERRCLTLTALRASGGAINDTPRDHFEHTMAALDRLVNEGAYGGSTISEMLINLLRREALLHVELSHGRLTNESSTRNQFSLAIAEELRNLGRPEFAEHLPYAEPSRGAWVRPSDNRLRASLRARRVPALDWNGGLVSVFGVRDLEQLAQQQKTVGILYPDGRQFLQDVADLTGPQLEREMTQRSETSAIPLWNDYSNALRLEIALLRRAVYAKGAGNVRVAALLSAQIRSEEGLLAAAFTDNPSWRNGEFNPLRGHVVDSEADILADARFLSRFAAMRTQTEVASRYEAFAAFKSRQLAKFHR